MFQTKDNCHSPEAKLASARAKSSAVSRLTTTTCEPSSTSLRMPRSMNASSFHILRRASGESSRNTRNGASVSRPSTEYEARELAEGRTSLAAIKKLGLESDGLFPVEAGTVGERDAA